MIPASILSLGPLFLHCYAFWKILTAFLSLTTLGLRPCVSCNYGTSHCCRQRYRAEHLRLLLLFASKHSGSLEPHKGTLPATGQCSANRPWHLLSAHSIPTNCRLRVLGCKISLHFGRLFTGIHHRHTLPSGDSRCPSRVHHALQKGGVRRLHACHRP